MRHLKKEDLRIEYNPSFPRYEVMLNAGEFEKVAFVNADKVKCESYIDRVLKYQEFCDKEEKNEKER